MDMATYIWIWIIYLFLDWIMSVVEDYYLPQGFVDIQLQQGTSVDTLITRAVPEHRLD